MSVPDHLFIVERVYDTGHYDLKTHAGLAAFVDAAVLALNEHDEKWGHILKKAGQKNIHGHAEDAALYMLPNNTAWAVDFIGGAGGTSPTLRWGPDPVAYYKHADWLDPAHHDVPSEPHPPPPPPPPPAPSFPYPDEPTSVLAYEKRVEKAYKAVGRKFPDEADPDAFRHFARYGYSCSKMPEPEAANKHIRELRGELGAPPE